MIYNTVRLGKAGLRVIIGARRPEDGAAAAAALQAEGLDASALHLDLGDAATVDAAAASIASAHGRLDVLVNNAGINDPDDGPPSKTSLAAVRRAFETNFVGMLMVTQAMLPLLRKSSAARIVNASSGLGSLQLNSDPEWKYGGHPLIGYGASKAAVNLMTILLAAELKEAGFLVNAADPGFTATDLTGHQGQTPADGAATTTRRPTVALPACSAARPSRRPSRLPWVARAAISTPKPAACSPTMSRPRPFSIRQGRCRAASSGRSSMT